MIDFILKIYGSLLQLYPAAFRNEFEEQMLLDFTDLLGEAGKKGTASLIVFSLHEMVDFPMSLFRAYLSDGQMLRMLRQPPVNYGLRGAVGFSVGFASLSFLGWQISSFLFSAFEPWIQTYTVWYYGTFQNERWIWLADDFVRLLFYILNACAFGVLFAAMSGSFRKRVRYFLAGACAWFIPIVTINVLSDSFGWSHYLSKTQGDVLGTLFSILTGTFLGAIFCIAESDAKEWKRFLGLAIFIYPLGTFFFMRLLFALWLEITPWFFPLVMAWMLVLVGSIAVVVLRTHRKLIWMILVGAIAHRLLNYVGFYITYSLLHFPNPASEVGIFTQNFTAYLLTDSVSQAITGLIFGLGLGLMFGLLKKQPLQLNAA